MKVELLIVDDDEQFLRSLSRALGDELKVRTASSPEEGRREFRRSADVVLLDIRLRGDSSDDKSGVDLLKEFLLLRPNVPVVMISAYGDVKTAVECMRLGAVDFIQKPVDIAELRERLKKAVEHARSAIRAQELEERLLVVEPVELVGFSPAMGKIKKQIQMVAQDGHITVLILGETGTGKGLVATAIHRLGWRSEGPFVAVPVSSITPSVVDSELFGHEPGAFTDARTRRKGFLEKASGGLLFLDEVGDLPAETQLKLLRFLEERRFTRLGSSEEVEVDVQVVSATNADLTQAVETRKFRKDLYFRLAGVEIVVPPLRERTEDIPILVEHFLGLLRRQGRTRLREVSSEALSRLQAYPWPGNVRELRSVLERAAMQAQFNGHTRIESEDLLLDAGRVSAGGLEAVELGEQGVNLDEELARVGLAYIERALRTAKGKKSEAWKLLGLNDRFALRRRVKSLLRAHPALASEFPLIEKLYSHEAD